MYKRNLLAKKQQSPESADGRELPPESARPLEDLITGYFFAAAAVLVQLENEAMAVDSFLKS